MKQLTTSFILAALLFQMTLVTNAGGGGIPGLDATFPMQLVQDVGIVSGAASGGVTAAATTLLTARETVVKPLINGLLTSALQQGANDTLIKIARGGADGASPLFVTNTAQYLANIEKGQYQKVISDLAGAGGDPSLLKTLVDNYRSTNSSIASLATKSNLPDILKRSVCDEQALSSRAQKDISSGLSISGLAEDAAYQARKSALYDSFGCGSAIITPEKQKVLLAANSQDPSIGGLQALYNMTVNGDNTYEKSLAITQATQAQAQAASTQAAAKVTATGGYIPQSLFSKVTNDINGDPCNADCPDDPNTEKVLTPAGTIADQANKAVGTGAEIAKNSLGTGDLFSFLGNLAGMLAGGMIANSITGGGTSSSNRPTITSTVDTRPNMTDAEHAKKVVAMNNQLNAHKTSLTSLKAIDAQFLALLQGYQIDLGALQSCYNDVVVYPNYISQAQPIKDFLLDRNGQIDEKLTLLQVEIPRIDPGLSTIATALSTIATSRKSDEIQSAFEIYQNQVDDKKIPDISSPTVRKTEYDSASKLIKTDKTNEYKTQSNNCYTLRQKARAANGYNPIVNQQPVLTCTNGADNPEGTPGNTCNHCPTSYTWDDSTKKCNAPSDTNPG